MTSFAERIAAAQAAAPKADPAELAKKLLEDSQAAGAAESISSSEQALSTADPSARSLQDDLTPILERSAVIGAFDVDQIIPEDASDRVRVRSALIRRSFPLDGQPGLRMLDDNLRRRLLTSLRASGRLEEVIAAIPDAPQDELGGRLQHMLSTLPSGQRDFHAETPAANAPALETLAVSHRGPADLAQATSQQTEQDLRNTLRVAEWTNQYQPEAIEALGRKIAYQAATNRLSEEADRVVGRDLLVDWLVAQLVEKPVDAGGSGPPIVAIWGVGGIGKSAVLAKLCARLTDLGNTAVIHIDFDRPGYGNADPAFLTVEYARQLGLTDPIIASAMQDIRARYAETLGAQKNPDVDGLESVLLSGDNTIAALAVAIERSTFRDRPVVVILDTFEERQRFGHRTVDDLNQWFRDLNRSVNQSRLSVLISGRVPPDANFGALTNYTGREIGALTGAESITLFKRLGHADHDAESLASLCDGNPDVADL